MPGVIPPQEGGRESVLTVTEDLHYVRENYEALLASAASIAARCGRPTPTLLPVTKSGTDEELIALCAAGATCIGENRPGELARRGALLRERGYTPQLHEIGTLQRNKVKYIAADVALIHSVDSLPLAQEIERQAERHGRRIPVLIEVNSAREPQKSGVLPEAAEALCQQVRALPHLALRGLMTMGPALDDAQLLRPYFRQTRLLLEALSGSVGWEGTPILSMGMSHSYEVAIEEGATLIRIGRRLFQK